MGFFSNLFGGGNAETLELPKPYRMAPGNLRSPQEEYRRFHGCMKTIMEDNGWFNNNYLQSFINAYENAGDKCTLTANFPPLCPGGDMGAGVFDDSRKPLFVAFSPFYDSCNRFYRPFGLVASSVPCINNIEPDNMQLLLYYNPDGESVIVDYRNRIWIDGRNCKIYNLR